MIYAFTLAFAVLSGWYDARDIRLKRDIDHGVRWAFRAMVVGVASCIAMMFTDRPLWHVLPLAVGCGFLFSAVFRLSLNLWRGLDWRYVSPSSWYDWQFLRSVGYHWREADIEQHASKYYGIGDLAVFQHQYRSNVHHAGLLAYTTEAVVFALTVWWACLHH